MLQETIVESRLAALEKDVQSLKQHLSDNPKARNWIAQVTGSMEDFPEFDQVLELGRSIRREDAPIPNDRDAQ